MKNDGEIPENKNITTEIAAISDNITVNKTKIAEKMQMN